MTNSIADRKLRARRNETSFFNGLSQLIQRNKRRYGGYIVHIGIVILYIGILGSKGYYLLESKGLHLGESVEVNDYRLTVQDAFQEEHPNFSLGGVVFAVERGGKPMGTMRPARGFYHKAGQGEQDTIESAIRHMGLNDLYIALGPLPENVPAPCAIGWHRQCSSLPQSADQCCLAWCCHHDDWWTGRTL